MALPLLRFATLSAALILAACGGSDTPDPQPEPTAPPETIQQDADAQPGAPLDESYADSPAFDPVTAPLAQVELAIRMQDAFRVRDENGANLTIDVESPALDAPLSEPFDLTAISAPDSPFLTSQQQDGFTIRTYGIAEADKDRMNTLRAKLVELKEAAPGQNALSFSATSHGCLETADDRPDTLQMTLYLRLHPTEDFAVLVPQQNLDLSAGSEAESYLQPCDTAG